MPLCYLNRFLQLWRFLKLSNCVVLHDDLVWYFCLESVLDRYKCMSGDLLSKPEINIFTKMQGVWCIFFTTRHLRRKKGTGMHPPLPKNLSFYFSAFLWIFNDLCFHFFCRNMFPILLLLWQILGVLLFLYRTKYSDNWLRLQWLLTVTLDTPLILTASVWRHVLTALTIIVVVI